MSTPTRRPARGQSLPESEVALLVSLRGNDRYYRVHQLYRAGWTLRAIGEVFNPPKARSTMQNWAERGALVSQTTRPLPEPRTPRYVTSAERKRPVSPGISDQDRVKIKRLAPVAKRYRSAMHPNHPAARANQELTELCRRLRDSGVTTAELAAVAGVTHRAMTKRMDKK